MLPAHDGPRNPGSHWHVEVPSASGTHTPLTQGSGSHGFLSEERK